MSNYFDHLLYFLRGYVEIKRLDCTCSNQLELMRYNVVKETFHAGACVVIVIILDDKLTAYKY